MQFVVSGRSTAALASFLYWSSKSGRYSSVDLIFFNLLINTVGSIRLERQLFSALVLPRYRV